jgi:SulP family sulfate permease
VSERRRSKGSLAAAAVGVVVGMVEAVLAISFAALVFGGSLAVNLADGIGLYLGAAALVLGILAWLAGDRGVVGSVQGSAAAVLAIVAAGAALSAFGGPDRAFLTVVAATVVVTVLTGAILLVLGRFEQGNLVRYVPFPVVGGFLAGAGWLLVKGGIGVSASTLVSFSTIGDLLAADELKRWLPALAFGVILLILTRVVKRPLVIPVVIGVGVAAFVVGMLVTGSSIDAARDGRWFVGPFPSGRLWQPWTLRALTGADWLGVLEQTAGILAAMFVAVIATLRNVGGTELVAGRDLDTNREFRDAGVVNVIAGGLGGIPGHHAPGLTSLAKGMDVDARLAGLVGALVPFTAAAFGGAIVELIPRMLVGGVLVFVGLGLLVEWVIDERKTLPRSEYIVVLLILAVVIARGFLPGVVVGLVLAVVLLAVNHGRIEPVREVPFGDAYRSNVDRAPRERAALREMGEQVRILRVEGFVFFGTASGLLERIREHGEAGRLRYLVLDLRRVTGVDSSAVVAFRKAAQLAQAHAFELVVTGERGKVREQLARGGVVEGGAVGFQPDLDRGLEHCEDGLLASASREAGGRPAPAGVAEGSALGVTGDGSLAMPAGLAAFVERVPLDEGTALIHQGDAPDDVFVLASGRLRIEMQTPEGTRMRLRTVLPGVVVGEIALYTGTARTADVVAETPSEVLRLSRASIERMEDAEPELAAALHRWLATTLSERLTDTQRAVGALFD